jgi:hypothetical protein
MKHTIYEIVKEYVIHPEGLGFPVRGRILKSTDSKPSYNYMWEISHYYKPHKEAVGVYIPSATVANTLEEIQHMLFRYMKQFTNIDVMASDY